MLFSSPDIGFLSLSLSLSLSLCVPLLLLRCRSFAHPGAYTTLANRKLRAQLNMGVDVDGRARDGQTALCIAASEGYHTLTAALVAAGADLNLPNSQTSFTPLHSAVHAGHTEVVRVLVAAGADLSATNRRKKTALQLALSRNYTEIVQVLQGKDNEEDTDETDSDESI